MVDHYLLLDKLHSIGLNKHTVLWLNSDLHNRRQCVVYQGFQSDYLTLDKDVPQGSTLGPLLFSFFINDLAQVFSHCELELYADDSVMYTSELDLLQIKRTLQSDFNKVQHWMFINKLLLNMKMSCCMVICTIQNGSLMQIVEEFKYLGLDSNLTFKIHIDNIISSVGSNALQK